MEFLKVEIEDIIREIVDYADLRSPSPLSEIGRYELGKDIESVFREHQIDNVYQVDFSADFSADFSDEIRISN